MRVGFVMVIVAACGGDGVRHTPDGRPADAPVGSDAIELDAPVCNAQHCCSVSDCPGGSYVCEQNACVDVAGTLSGLLWQLPCGTDASPTVCNTIPTVDVSTTMGGTTGYTYDVTVHLRGIIEQKTYSGGCQDAYWLAGGADSGDGYNVYELQISSPPQTYFLNAGASNIQNTWVLDYMKTFRADAGATVRLYATSKDNQEIKNVDANGQPLSVGGTSVTEPYNGQFIQMDVVSVAPDPVATGATVGGGTAGNALSFAGGQVVTIADAPSLEPADFTYETWFQFAGTAGSYNMLGGKPFGTGSEDSFALWWQSGTLLSGSALNSPNAAAGIAWTPVNNEWHHAAVSYDHTASQTALYIDGVAVACSTNGAPNYDTHPMMIGADIDNGSQQGYFVGAFDEVRLFSTARTADQVWADMHTHQLGPTTGLVGEWTFDEGTGDTAADSSGTGNGATLGSGAGSAADDPAWVTSTVPH